MLTPTMENMIFLSSDMGKGVRNEELGVRNEELGMKNEELGIRN